MYMIHVGCVCYVYCLNDQRMLYMTSVTPVIIGNCNINPSQFVCCTRYWVSIIHGHCLVCLTMLYWSMIVFDTAISSFVNKSHIYYKCIDLGA